MRRRRVVVTVTALAVLVAALAVVAGTQGWPRAWSPQGSPGPTPLVSASAGTTSAAPRPGRTSEPGTLSSRVRAPREAATVLPATDPVAAAVQASSAVFESAPVVVVASHDDPAAQLTGASAAVAVGGPLLLVTGTGADRPVQAEVVRLGARTVLVVGSASTRSLPEALTLVPVTAGAGPDELAAVTGEPFAERVAARSPVSAVARLGSEPFPALVVPGSSPKATPRATAAATRAPTSTPTASTPTASSTRSSTAGPSAPPSPTTSATPTASPSAARTPAPEPSRLPATRRPQRVEGLVGLTGAGGDTTAAVATLRAARVPLVSVPGGDPRAATRTVRELAKAETTHVVALGSAFGPADRLATRVATAATGTLAPGGGQLVFPQVEGVPTKRYVALYGSPGSGALGVLGEQDVPETIARAQKVARHYRPLTDATVVPAVEVIATIASSGAGDDGDYSRERSVAELRPLVEAAGEAGVAVVLDLQPGRTDFLTQAKRYRELLELPYVGLALDPEWRLEPDQVHLEQIGSVGIDEVNEVADWLAELTASNHLPQKMFVLHQFSLRMISDRARLDTSHDELATVIHVDGQGTQPAKRDTWRTLRRGAPPVHWGWKNFHDEDSPMLTPKETYQVDPVPDLVTYQ
ncbi:hypothetical protein [Cellulomonas palmilytica]|uniref:hypothetical protein n=1 Tax=Cellulomonas palmilytica TaxID=2608402 RepID=UPI001F3079E1|nr:hypothetical protein [Cellulomonas palmilytica]UJP39429.1 hypothetical protein F1D97_14015 [Cellulomonas palmilytica]